MIVLLKILLSIFALISIIIGFFIIREYKKFSSSEEAKNNSVFNKFVIMVIAFGTFIVFAALGALSIYFIFQDISVN